MRLPPACLKSGENKMKTKEEVCEKNPRLVIKDSKSSLPIILLLYSPGAKKSTSFRRKILQICFLNWNKKYLPSAICITSPSSWNNKCQKRTSLIREASDEAITNATLRSVKIGKPHLFYIFLFLCTIVVLVLVLSLLTSTADLPSVPCLLNLAQIMVLGKT